MKLKNILKNCFIFFIFFSNLIFSSLNSIKKANIGLLIVATGKYISFVPKLIESAEKYFCKKHHVTYFIFTDGQVPDHKDVVRIEQKRLGWPYDTMMRFAMYAEHGNKLQGMDYLFACDADMLFVDEVGNEILGDRVGTLHPGFVGSRGTYETNPKSTACIPPHEGKCYFAGGFNGGSRDEFLKMAQTIANNVQEDLKKGFIAVWHDESHLNRYFIDNVPTVILTPSHCYPEGWNLPYHPRLIALNKNHKEVRT